MPLSTAGKNTAADSIASGYSWLALYNGDPAGAGTEINGGSPAYARKQPTMGASSGGVKSMTGTVTFDIPTGATVTHYAWMSASSGGTMGGSGALSASEGPYGGQGTYQVTAASITVS